MAPPVSRARGGLRLAYAFVYSAAAVLGISLLAWPATAFVQGLGLLHPVLPAPVRGGAVALLLLLLLGTLALRFALALVRGLRPRLGEHAGFLLALACAAAVRAAGGPVLAPADPSPALEAGLRAAADALDRIWSSGRYAPDAALLESAVAGLPPPGFVSRARSLPLRARLVLRGTSAAGPVLEPLPGDPPGTIYVALSDDGRRAFLTALTLERGRPSPLRLGGRALVVRASGGTHGAIGGDPLLPAYPSMRTLARPGTSP